MSSRISDHLTESDRAFLRNIEFVVPGANYKMFPATATPAAKPPTPYDELWRLLDELVFKPDAAGNPRFMP